MSMHQNLIRIRAVNEQLKDLGQDFVFVGGATVSLYATESALALEIRPTDDVDVVIELASYGGYSQLDEKLRLLGFSNDIETLLTHFIQHYTNTLSTPTQSPHSN